ncbi:MAG: D-alanyl-D-alanine carboxypeptidase family protein [Pseudomonadota bacterium]
MMLSPWTMTLKRSAVGFALAGMMALATPNAHGEKYASIVIDADTDTVLHARYADETRFPASLTKVMTLYMLFEEVDSGRLSLDDMMTASSTAAAKPPSKLGLRAGDQISVRDAIQALVTKSANDVACVVAEHLGVTEARFAALMTVKARTLGMANTRFYNASGLPDSRQVSTARDMAVLAEAMLDDFSHHYDFFSTQTFRWNGRTYKNHNELLGDVEGVDGIKTGYTRASGYNLMSSAERGDSRVIVIMLGGRTARARNDHVTELIEAAYESFDQPGSAPALRTHIAFERIQKPIDPNAAAVPTLNGKPLTIGEGDEQ